jgi:hypothetical protein
MSVNAVRIAVRLGVTLSVGSSPVIAQPGAAKAAVGAERISALLTEQGQWTLYWSTLGGGPRPPASAGTGTIAFTRRGNKLLARISIPVMARECEFEVVVTETGFKYPGCPSPQDRLVRAPDRDIAYDPDDREYPFKGAGGFHLVLVPAPITRRQPCRCRSRGGE